MLPTVKYSNFMEFLGRKKRHYYLKKILFFFKLDRLKKAFTKRSMYTKQVPRCVVLAVLPCASPPPAVLAARAGASKCSYVPLPSRRKPPPPPPPPRPSRPSRGPSRPPSRRPRSKPPPLPFEIIYLFKLYFFWRITEK